MPLVEASRATIYTVGLFDPDDRELNPGVLRKLANASGGEYFEPQRLDEVIPTSLRFLRIFAAAIRLATPRTKRTTSE